MKILLLGSQGLLGQAIFNYFLDKKEIDLIPLSSFNFDIRDDINELLDSFKPDFLVNSAAFSDVDLAEKEKELAMEINGNSVSKMARTCYKKNVDFIHFSTDYVFDGSTGNYSEDSKPNPINFYGESKLEGEKKALEYNENAKIIRTARLYDKWKENFSGFVLHSIKTKKNIDIISDEIGNYTYCKDLAKNLFTLIQDKNKKGIFHITGFDAVSPFDFANKIKLLKKSEINIDPIKSSSLVREAKRPKNTSLINTKLEKMPNLDESLNEFLNQ